MATRADEPREAASLDDARIRLEGQLEVVEKLTSQWRQAAAELRGEAWHTTGKDLWGPLASSDEAEHVAVSAAKEEPGAHGQLAELRAAQNAAVDAARGRLSELGVQSTASGRGALSELLAQLPLHFDHELVDFTSFRAPVLVGLAAGTLTVLLLMATTRGHYPLGGQVFMFGAIAVLMATFTNWLLKPGRRVVLREGTLTLGDRVMHLDEVKVVEGHVYQGVVKLDHLVRVDGETIRLHGGGRLALELLELLRAAGVNVSVETRVRPSSS